MKICILSVVYHEPHWQSTKACIEATELPVHYVERNPPGVGSLAEAINRGFKQLPECEFFWVVTNVTFFTSMPEDLLYQMEVTKCAAIHPCFDSDHKHLQQKIMDIGVAPTLPVPFIEFTAPMIRTDVFKQFQLDEKMPYVGHDMDWSYRVQKAGYEIGCFHDEKIGHVYIRHNKGGHPITEKRKRLRQRAVQPTIKRLIELYGPNYKNIIQYHGAL